MSETLELTFGQKRVRASFNPSKDSLVDQIKAKTAELIDLCSDASRKANQDTHRTGEEGRLWALAMSEYENAAMWAVKAATSGK